MKLTTTLALLNGEGLSDKRWRTDPKPEWIVALEASGLVASKDEPIPLTRICALYGVRAALQAFYAAVENPVPVARALCTAIAEALDDSSARKAIISDAAHSTSDEDVILSPSAFIGAVVAEDGLRIFMDYVS